MEEKDEAQSEHPAAATIQNARLLLDYSARHMIDIPPKHIEAILKADFHLRENAALLPEQELDLRVHFREICRAVAPITIESLTDTYGENLHVSYATRQGKHAVGWIKWIAGGTLLTLLLTLMLQWFWLAGGSMMNDVQNGLARYTLITNQLIALEAENGPGDSAEIERLYSEMETVFGRLTANHQSLHHWNLSWANAIPGEALPFEHESYQSMDLATRAQVDAASAQLILQAIVSYTLPMLFGLLGSGVYVIRTLSRDVANITFTKEQLWQSVIRLAMGPMAGVAIGLLIVPEVPGQAAGATEFVNQLSVLSTLSPLALAFVAGYGIELLFAMLDRIINAFVSLRE